MDKGGGQEQILTLPEVARLLRVHPTTIYRMVQHKQLPAFKVGSDWRFNLASIENWIREMEDREYPSGRRPR